MNKLLCFISLSFVLLFIASCEEKVQVCSAKVKSISDSTVTMTIDKYDIVFDAKQANFANGAVIPGDSAKVSYIGNLRDKKAQALIVELIPIKGNVIKHEVDLSRKLETAPMSKEKKEDIDKFVEISKKRGH